MIQYISYIISCSIGTYIAFDFMQNIFSMKPLKKPILLLIKLLFFLAWFIINQFEIPFLNLSFFTIACFIVGFTVFGISHLKEIVQISVFIVCYSGCDSIISSLLSILNKDSIPFYEQNSYQFLLNIILVQLTMLFLNKFVILYVQHKRLDTLKLRQVILLFIFPVLNMLIYCILSIAANKDWSVSIIHYIIVLLVIISTVLNLAVIYFFEYVAKTAQLENDLTLMHQKMDMQYSYYNGLEMEYENSQKIMHDIKSHIEVIESLNREDLSTGQIYAKKIYDIIDNTKMKFRCNNRIMNVILNEEMKKCEQENIDFKVSVENLDSIFLNDIDITTIFANLLDNAIDACKKIDMGPKCLELRMYKYNEMIIINVINNIMQMPKQASGHFLSSKKGHKAIGLSNVQYIVEKYKGDMNITIEENKFAVSIIFPIFSL